MGESGVVDVCEVEEVVVVVYLEVVFVIVVGVEEVGKCLDVVFIEEIGWVNGVGNEFGVVGVVGVKDDFFGGGFGFGVVFDLGVVVDDWLVFVGIVEVVFYVVDDIGGGGVDESFDVGFVVSVNYRLCIIDIDFFEEFFLLFNFVVNGMVSLWGGSVNDYVWVDFIKDRD